MRTKLLLPVYFCVFSLHLSAFGQGTAFTYQGRLTVGTNVANGIYDLRFRLFDDPSAGTQVGPSRTNLALSVSNGFFAVALDFTNGAFPGADRWLDIAVRSNTVSAFSSLTPRQKITPTPYAITASTLSGTLPSAQLAGTYTSAVTFTNAGNSFTGNGTGLTNVNAATLGGLTSSNFWRTTGNAGTTPGTHFLGTTDNQALELKVNGLRTLRIEFNTNLFAPNGGAPNLIGGAPVNFVNSGVVGATIAGGGATDYAGAGNTNSVLSDFGTVGGGFANRIAPSGLAGTIAGGRGNAIGTNSDYGAIGGGGGNNIAASAVYATIAGGDRNDIGAGGYGAIGGGSDNNIAVNAAYATIAGGHFNDIGTLSRYSAIGGGDNNNIASFSDYSTIAGGLENDIGTNSYASTIGGGNDNNIATNTGYATIAGGEFNRVGTNSGFSTIGGGKDNNVAANAEYATIPGGQNNAAGGDHSFAAGHRAKANHQGAFVWADSANADFVSTASNQFLVRASSGVGINTANPVGDLHVNGPIVIQGTLTPGSTSSSNLLNLMVGGGSSPVATNGSLNGISFYEAAASKAMSLGYDGSSSSSSNALRIYNNSGSALFTFENSGDLGVGTTTPAERLHVIGDILATGTITPNSDRNAKTDIAPVSARDMLERVTGLPIAQWRFKAEAAGVRHIGPMAQDFHAAFGLGERETAIATVDADGVALAAIQGLNQKVEGRSQKSDMRIQKLETENAELKQRLEKLERLLEIRAVPEANPNGDPL